MKFDICIIGITLYLTTFTNAAPVNRISPQGIAGVVVPGLPPSNPTVANVAPAGNPPTRYVNTAQAPGSYNVYPASIPQSYTPQSYTPQSSTPQSSTPQSSTPPLQLSGLAQPAQSGTDVLAYLSEAISQSSPQALESLSKAMPASIDLPKIGDE